MCILHLSDCIKFTIFHTKKNELFNTKENFLYIFCLINHHILLELDKWKNIRIISAYFNIDCYYCFASSCLFTIAMRSEKKNRRSFTFWSKVILCSTLFAVEIVRKIASKRFSRLYLTFAKSIKKLTALAKIETTDTRFIRRTHLYSISNDNNKY